MANKEVKINVTGKHVHRTSIDLNNPQKANKDDWWEQICKKHGEKNHFPNKRKKNERS
tara:strand:+ start:515 stop:688 length:174 start_codon:yes stop_codon:yes gene_type:complete